MKLVFNWLDATTMYRVVLYVLGAWFVASLGLSIAGLLFFSPWEILASVSVITLISISTHYVCAYIWKAPANIESTLITSLILFFLFDPVLTIVGLAGLAGAAVISVVGKYVLMYRKSHLLNPAALAAFAGSIFGFAFATWWIGNVWMLPLVVIGGFLITAKIRRYALVLSTIIAGLIVYLSVAFFTGGLSWNTLWVFFASWPILFFATTMVTEPLSTPAGHTQQIIYGAIAGGLSSVPFAFGPIYSSPELALLVANMVFWPLSLRGKLQLEFQSMKEIARDTYEFIFASRFPFSYKPGQYLEWTLPHDNPDKRGIARYFTIASSPTEETVKLGMRLVPEDSDRVGSSFKKAMKSMELGDLVYASSRDGEFLLPRKIQKSLVFIAGGIGITPFRSMVKFIHDSDVTTEDRQKPDVTLFYCNKSEEDIAYQDIWDEAKGFLTTVNVLDTPTPSWTGESGYLTEEILEKYVPEYTTALFYISGPPGMVATYSALLKRSGVPSRNIKKDYFPGLA